jgi:hypothetical protein
MSSRYVPCEKCGKEIGEFYSDGKWERGRHTHTRSDDGECDPADLETRRLQSELDRVRTAKTLGLPEQTLKDNEDFTAAQTRAAFGSLWTPVGSCGGTGCGLASCVTCSPVMR